MERKTVGLARVDLDLGNDWNADRRHFLPIRQVNHEEGIAGPEDQSFAQATIQFKLSEHLHFSAKPIACRDEIVIQIIEKPNVATGHATSSKYHGIVKKLNWPAIDGGVSTCCSRDCHCGFTRDVRQAAWRFVEIVMPVGDGFLGGFLGHEFSDGGHFLFQDFDRPGAGQQLYRLGAALQDDLRRALRKPLSLSPKSIFDLKGEAADRCDRGQGDPYFCPQTAAADLYDLDDRIGSEMTFEMGDTHEFTDKKERELGSSIAVEFDVDAEFILGCDLMFHSRLPLSRALHAEHCTAGQA